MKSVEPYFDQLARVVTDDSLDVAVVAFEPVPKLVFCVVAALN